MEPSPSPDFDAAAAAARFCARAQALATYRRIRAVMDAADELEAGANGDSDLGAALTVVWKEYVAVGGSLGELYGVAS